MEGVDFLGAELLENLLFKIKFWDYDLGIKFCRSLKRFFLYNCYDFYAQNGFMKNEILCPKQSF